MYNLIIFDVDGTFYNLEDVVADNYKMQLNFFAEQKKFTADVVEQIFEENGILPYKSERARSATEFFLKNGIDPEEWRAYRENHTSPQSIKKETSVTNNVLVQYAKRAKLVLLSSNTQKNIDNTLEWLEIDKSIFADVFCSTTPTVEKPFNKMAVVPQILAKFDVSPQETLCVGDRYESDIRPLVELGGNGVLINNPLDLIEVFEELSCGTLGDSGTKAYKFYNGAYMKGDYNQ